MPRVATKTWQNDPYAQREYGGVPCHLHSKRETNTTQFSTRLAWLSRPFQSPKLKQVPQKKASKKDERQVAIRPRLSSRPSVFLRGYPLLYLRASTGASPLHISLTFCAFELAVASCTPLVPFVAKIPLTSCLSPLASYASRLSPLTPQKKYVVPCVGKSLRFCRGNFCTPKIDRKALGVAPCLRRRPGTGAAMSRRPDRDRP